MNTHKRQIKGQTVKAYNDSNQEWVVQSDDNLPQRFSMSEWTMTAAIEFYAEIFEEK